MYIQIILCQPMERCLMMKVSFEHLNKRKIDLMEKYSGLK